MKTASACPLHQDEDAKWEREDKGREHDEEEVFPETGHASERTAGDRHPESYQPVDQ